MGGSNSTPSVFYSFSYRKEDGETPRGCSNRQLSDLHFTESNNAMPQRKDLKDFVNTVDWDPTLGDGDKALVQTARSIITQRYRNFDTDYELTITLSDCEWCFWNGDRTYKLIVQRDGSDKITVNGRGPFLIHLQDIAILISSKVLDELKKMAVAKLVGFIGRACCHLLNSVKKLASWFNADNTEVAKPVQQIALD